ncbi:bile acid:sodium symporter family protein [Natronorarus salvus]|uniref:bile acid:sodium symporter family protein n=1 Tax=Natronorarus salvus TaxID=3117733 RepID=UPI002F2615D3
MIGRFENVLLVAVAVAAGVAGPSVGAALEPLVTPLVVFLVYTSLRGLRPAEVEVRSYGLLVALSLCLSYVVLPAGGIGLARLVLDGGALVGFAIALSVPTTAGSAIVWTRFSGGDVQLATTTSIASLLFGPVATPIVLAALVGTGAGVPATAVLVDLAVIVVGGVLLAVVIPSDTFSARTVDGATTFAILLLIYTSVAAVDPAGVAVRDLLGIVGVSVFLLCFGLALTLICKRAFGLDRPRALSLFFTSSLKNLGIALLVALAFADPLVVLAIITYYVLQQLSGAVLADVVP